MLGFDAVPYLRQLVAGFSPQRLGFDPWSFHSISVVDKVALGQFFLRIFRVSPVSIIPPVLHTFLQLHIARNRRTSGRDLGTFQKAVLLWKSANFG